MDIRLICDTISINYDSGRVGKGVSFETIEHDGYYQLYK